MPGPTLCCSCPPPPWPCLSRLRAVCLTKSRSWNNIPRPWEMDWTFFLTGWVLKATLWICICVACSVKQGFKPTFNPFPPSFQMGQAAQAISSLPYSGENDLGQDKISKLINLHFLLSCFRRDSHKIDSFLKVLRCRMANMLPEMCWGRCSAIGPSLSTTANCYPLKFWSFIRFIRRSSLKPSVFAQSDSNGKIYDI